MSHDFFDGHNGPDWQDWMIIGPMSEDIANEQQEQDRLIRDFEDSEDDYIDNDEDLDL